MIDPGSSPGGGNFGTPSRGRGRVFSSSSASSSFFLVGRGARADGRRSATTGARGPREEQARGNLRKTPQNGTAAAPAASFCLFAPFKNAQKRVPSFKKRSEFSSVSPSKYHRCGENSKISFLVWPLSHFPMKKHSAKRALFSTYAAKAIEIAKLCDPCGF